MMLLVYTVVQAPEVALASTLATLAGSLALFAAFFAIERRSAAPLVRLAILRSAPLARANIGGMLFISAFMAWQFVVVLYLQELRGWSAIETGLALLIIGSDAVLAPTVTPRLMRRFGTGRMALAGMVLAALAYASFLPLGADWSYLTMLPAMIALGLAFALAYGALTIAATDGIAEEEQGLASGLLNVCFQFGAAVGYAVVAAVNVAATDGTSHEELLDGYRAALIVPVVAVVLGVLVTVARRRRATPRTAAAPAG